MARLEHNLAEGSVARQLILFSIPFVLSSLVQNIYGLADLIVIGQFAGTASLAGVNTGSAYVSAITNIAIGFCNGGTVVIGQYMGMKRPDKLREVIGTLCCFVALLALAITGITLGLRGNILDLLQVPGEAQREALVYLTVSAAGFFFIFGYNMLSAILRGVGESRKPFFYICVACIINVLLDLLLCGPLEMGARGAALATITAQGLSMILCIIDLRRSDFVFDFRPSSFRIRRESLVLLLKVGIPTALQGSLGVFAYVILTGITNTLGVSASAAMAGGQKITLFAILPSIALGNSIAAMCAQNFGADRPDRALHTMRVGWVLTFSVNLLLFALVEIFPAPLMRIFDGDPEVVRLGIVFLHWCCFDFLFVPFYGSLTGFLIGSGHTALPLALSLMGSLLLRAPAAYILCRLAGLGIAGVGMATPLASLFTGGFSLLYYLTGRCGRIRRLVKDSVKACDES